MNKRAFGILLFILIFTIILLFSFNSYQKQLNISLSEQAKRNVIHRADSAGIYLSTIISNKINAVKAIIKNNPEIKALKLINILESIEDESCHHYISKSQNIAPCDNLKKATHNRMLFTLINKTEIESIKEIRISTILNNRALNSMDDSTHIIIIMPLKLENSDGNLFILMPMQKIAGQYFKRTTNNNLGKLYLFCMKHAELYFSKEAMDKIKNNEKNNGVIVKEDNYIGYSTLNLYGQELLILYSSKLQDSSKQINEMTKSANLFIISIITIIYLLAFLLLFKYSRDNKKLELTVEERTKNINELQKRYYDLFQSVPEMVIAHTKDGDILEYNRSTEAYIRLDSNRNIYKMLAEGEKLKKLIVGLNPDEQADYGSFTLKNNSSSKTVEVLTSICEYDGKPSYITILRDLTEMSKAQKTYMESEKHEAVGTLASGLAHDVKNILQNVNLQTQLIERTSEIEQAKKHAEIIKDVVDQASEFITGLLSFSKDTRKNFIVMNLSEATDKAMTLIEKVIPRRIDLVYKDNTDGLNVRIVENRFIQSILNLCLNAADAIELNGKIHVIIDEDEDIIGKKALIKVKDTGKGISPENIDQIFETFYSTKGDKGTGLGLTTVKKFVLEAGGFISVESEVGKGTEFIISLPVVK